MEDIRFLFFLPLENTERGISRGMVGSGERLYEYMIKLEKRVTYCIKKGLSHGRTVLRARLLRETRFEALREGDPATHGDR